MTADKRYSKELERYNLVATSTEYSIRQRIILYRTKPKSKWLVCRVSVSRFRKLVEDKPQHFFWVK